MGEALRKQARTVVQDGPVTNRSRSARRRVFVEDVRGNGHYLRATWHADDQIVVVSTWREEVCTGAVRLPVEATADLAGLLVGGLGEALTRAPVRTGRPGAADRWATLRRQVRVWSQRILPHR